MFDNDLILGRLSDEIDAIQPQEDVNEESLYLKDESDLLLVVGQRATNEILDYYFDKVENTNYDLWVKCLKEYIKEYHVTNLKLFLSESFKLEDYAVEIKKLIKYTKINLINRIIINDENHIKLPISRDELETVLFADSECPLLLKWGIKYIDGESYSLFIQRLFTESKMSIEEI